MADIGEIERKITGLSEKKGEEKLQEAKQLWNELQALERSIARDYSVPVYVIRKVRELAPDLEATINRLEAGARRKAAKA